jgi:hypothetical protein
MDDMGALDDLDVARNVATLMERPADASLLRFHGRGSDGEWSARAVPRLHLVHGERLVDVN